MKTTQAPTKVNGTRNNKPWSLCLTDKTFPKIRLTKFPWCANMRVTMSQLLTFKKVTKVEKNEMVALIRLVFLHMPESRFEPPTLIGIDEKSYLYVMYVIEIR